MTESVSIGMKDPEVSEGNHGLRVKMPTSELAFLYSHWHNLCENPLHSNEAARNSPAESHPVRAHFSLFTRKGAQGDGLIYRYLHHRLLTLRQMNPLIPS